MEAALFQFSVNAHLLPVSDESMQSEWKGTALPVTYWAADCFHHFFFFLPVTFQSSMLYASSLMHILTPLLTPKLEGRSIYRALCYALSLQHVVYLHSSDSRRDLASPPRMDTCLSAVMISMWAISPVFRQYICIHENALVSSTQCSSFADLRWRSSL